MLFIKSSTQPDRKYLTVLTHPHYDPLANLLILPRLMVLEGIERF